MTDPVLLRLAGACQLLVRGGNFRDELNASLHIIGQVVGATSLGVTLCDASRRKLQTAAEYHASDLRSPGPRTDIVRQVIRSCSPVTIPHFASAGSPARSLDNPELILHCVPIEVEQKAAGALTAILPHGDAAGEKVALDLLLFVVPMIAQSVRVARLIETATRRMLDDDARLREELSRRYDLSRLVGNSGAMRQVCEQIAQVAPSSATVLIQGESGTGKELIAHAIHINSQRAEKPLIRVNCPALPEQLIEAELFGCEAGAFTGAIAPRAGKFQMAEGGTVFLDEVGELSPTAQIKLLRILQDRKYERLGGTDTLTADVRVVAATNRNLEKEVNARRFREDLYYRLNVFTIISPPLRSRRDDIPLLARNFLAAHGPAKSKSVCHFSAAALSLLKSYDWPGNVRELENAVEHALVVCDGDVIEHYHLPGALQALRESAWTNEQSLTQAVEAYEKELLCESLKSTCGNRNRAAKLLKISERLLTYKVKKYHIDCDQYRR
jgi:Nif-specific regulatory protein